MKISVVSFGTFCLLAAFFFISCGKKSQKEKEFVIIDSDTISVEELAKTAPDSALAPERVGLMALLARKCPQFQDTGGINEVVEDFSEQLSRESDKDLTIDLLRFNYN
jgi:hypothetical protein